MSREFIERFAAAPCPGFICEAAGSDSDAKFVARVQHILGDPASRAGIKRIEKFLGELAAPFSQFYRYHDGFLLYRDTLSESAGILLYPASHWGKATKEMRKWHEYLAEHPEDDPNHIFTGIAFAEAFQSANYFVIPVEPPSHGRVFYVSHEGGYGPPFADDFDGFLRKVTLDPPKLLNDELGCYTRYSDGKTRAQWIPQKYFEDISQARA